MTHYCVSHVAVLVGLLFAVSGPNFALSGSNAVASESAPPATIEVTIREGLLTLNVRDQPLSNVLRAIAEQAGFELKLTTDLDQPITWSVSSVSLDEGIRLLAGKNSLIMSYRPSEKGPISQQLVKVWVLGKPDPVATIRPIPDKTAMAHGDRDHAKPDRSARLRTVRQLVHRSDETAVETLAAFLSLDDDPVIRRIAARGLGKLGGKQATAVLAKALNDEDRSVKRRAIFELGKINDDWAAGKLGDVLMDDSDDQIRRFAAYTLGQMDSVNALDALSAAASDPDVMIRQAVAAALARLQEF